MSHRATDLAALCLERCRTISRFTDVPGKTTRTYLSPSTRDCYRYLGEAMKAAQMSVHVDAAGNLRSVYPAAQVGSGRLVIGSHLDTVPNAGAYDGVLGVVIGLTLVEALGGRKLPFEIELIGFSEEEGVRFGFPFIGSRAFSGSLEDSLLERRDAHGISVAEAIDDFGLDCARLADASADERSAGYLEFHIEQGPVLESLQQPLGVVDSISGQSRAAVTFEGQANHAGTTPMRFRRDALAATAEWVLAVEAHGNAIQGLVSTVGKFDVPGAAANIVAGRVTASLDVRHSRDDARRAAFEHCVDQGENIARRRGLRFSHSVQLDQSSVFMDCALVSLAEQAVQACGLEPVRLASGAGHDAMIVAPVLPSVMIFLRSPGGVSHSPEESVLLEDVAYALEVGAQFLEGFGSTLR